MPSTQPTGQLSHTPVTPSMAENTKASTTRSTRSVMVEAMKSFIREAPRSTPSLMSFMAMTT